MIYFAIVMEQCVRAIRGLMENAIVIVLAINKNKGYLTRKHIK